MLPHGLFNPTAPALIKRSQTPPPGKANAQRLKSDRPASAPLPLSPRQQQVLTQRNQGFSFKAIANCLGCSPAAAIEHYDRAFAKLQTTTANAITALEPNDRSTKATPEPAIVESPRDRPSGKNFDPIKTLLRHDVCTRLKPFHKTEFTIGFGQLCVLKQVAWSVPITYRDFGYQCKIQCGAEVIEVDGLVGESELHQRRQNLFRSAVS